MEEAPENGKESSHSAHANGMSEWPFLNYQLSLNMCPIILCVCDVNRGT